MTRMKLKVSDFAEVSTGGTPSTSKREFWDGGTIPWLNSGELNQDIVTTCSNYITPEGLSSSAARIMPPDTVLIALTGTTTGKAAYLTFEACANQSVTGILPSPKHFPKYLYHYLSSIRQQILNDSYGGAQKHISQGYVKNLEVPLPTLETQQKIAAILDKADALRQKDKQLLAKYDELADSVFDKMFGNWAERKPLSELTHHITDGVHLKPNYTETGVPFISVKNITNRFLDFTDCKFVSQADYKTMTKKWKAERDDVLYTKVGATYGRAAIVDTDRDFGLYVSVALLKPKKELINPQFLLAVLNTDFVKRQADRSIKGAGVPDLHLVEIRKFEIPLPPFELQTQFATIIKQIEKQKQKAQEQLQKSEDLFQSLLQKAFNGELVS